MDNRRRQILEGLVNLTGDLDSIQSQLSMLSWDCDEPVISMSLENVRSVLRSCLQGQMTIDDLEKWAELIELREDIEFVENDSDRIKFIINVLANPEINGKVDCSILQQWIKN